MHVPRPHLYLRKMIFEAAALAAVHVLELPPFQVLCEEVLVTLLHLAMAHQSIVPSILRPSTIPYSTTPVHSSEKLFLSCPRFSPATSSPGVTPALCLRNNYWWIGSTSPCHLSTNPPGYSANSPLNLQPLFPMRSEIVCDHRHRQCSPRKDAG